jgi:hypothetical protein
MRASVSDLAGGAKRQQVDDEIGVAIDVLKRIERINDNPWVITRAFQHPAGMTLS